MYVQLVVMFLLVLAAPFRAETEVSTPCAEAQANYNGCTEEKGYDQCWDLYYKTLGACYSKAWQECAETEHEYFSKDCDKIGEEERDESCDGLKEKIGRICTNEWYLQLDQTTGPLTDVKK